MLLYNCVHHSFVEYHIFREPSQPFQGFGLWAPRSIFSHAFLHNALDILKCIAVLEKIVAMMFW